MANAIVRLPLGYFPDPNKGRPLGNAKIYVGIVDLDPRILANQLTVTGRQESGTEVPLPQPIRTSFGGVPVDANGNVVTLLVDGAYAMAVDDSKNPQNQVYYFANVLDGAPLTFSDNPVLYRDTILIATTDEGLSVGQYISTKGYTSANDGGGDNYIVVAGGTGTSDGGLYHDTTAGLQLELIVDGRLNALSFGVSKSATDSDSVQMMAFINTDLPLYVPSGEYFFPTSNFIVGNNFDLIGDGKNKTTIGFNEGSGPNAGDPLANSLFRSSELGDKESFSLSDICIKGTRTETDFNEGGAPIFISDFGSVVIENVRIKDTKHFAMAGNRCGSLRVFGCNLDSISRDGIRFIDTPNVFISNNIINRTGDDCIALHSGDGFLVEVPGQPFRNSIIISDNVFSGCSPIVILGARTIDIHDNVFKRMNVFAISVLPGTSTFPEGHNSVYDISINDNIIQDTLGVPTQSSPLYPIVVANNGTNGTGSAPTGNAATNGIPTTFYDSVSGSFIFPWDFDSNASTAADGIVQMAYRVNISNNKISRTLPNVSKYSDYGQGKQMIAGGELVDNAVIDASFTCSQLVRASGAFYSLSIDENLLSQQCVTSVILSLKGNNESCRSFSVSRNDLYDFDSIGISVQIDGASDVLSGGKIKDNTILGDIYRRNAKSNVNGTYTSGGNPSAMSINQANGVVISGNTISNVNSVIGGGDPSNQICYDNILYATAASRGFNVLNVGVGDIPFDSANEFRVVGGDFDPTSSGYFTTTQDPAVYRSSVPPSGTYKKGTVLLSTAAAQSGISPDKYILTGWKKITDGSTNVLNTDWVEMRSLTGN